jgi:hypothetical protein
MRLPAIAPGPVISFVSQSLRDIRDQKVALFGDGGVLGVVDAPHKCRTRTWVHSSRPLGNVERSILPSGSDLPWSALHPESGPCTRRPPRAW